MVRGGAERIASLCLLAIVFLLPIFFVPSVSYPFQFSKIVLVSGLALVAFALWLIGRLKDGRFVFPGSPMLVVLFVIAGLFALSSLFSGTVTSSFFGQGFEVGTAVNMLLLSVMAFLTSVMFRRKEQLFGSYVAFLASFLLVALFQILRFAFGPDFLSFGIFTETASNTVGKWNDLGIFFGVATLLSLITIEFLSLNRLFKSIVYLSLPLSLAGIAIVNFSLVWYVLALFSLVFLVYLMSFGSSRKSRLNEDAGDISPASVKPLKRLPIPSLLVLLVSVVFILPGNTLGSQIGGALGISQIEARPTWGTTFDVARQTLVKDPLLGAGPNQFVSEWLKYKPFGVNNTPFWNVDFNFGVGLVPTFLATTGILGFLAWAIFFLLFLVSGFKAILSDLSDTFSQYLVTSSFLTALFLWIVAVFYVPSLTIFALTFFFTGLFVASLAVSRIVPMKTLSFADNPRASFVSVLLLILLLIGSVTLGYTLFQKYTGSVLFQKGVISFNTEGDLAKAERLIARAAEMSPQDIYYRFLTELTLMRINTVLRQGTDTISPEAARTEFQNLLGVALSSARKAVAQNPRNYENLMSLGRVYEAVVPLKIEGAYENARTHYGHALELNPRGPAIHLTIARLEATKGDNSKARESILSALQEKSNYTEAIFLLSQIEVQEGNIKGAIASVEAAATIAPNDGAVFFQLGLLRFNDRNYLGAVGALERAVKLNPDYANAKYFLGLSYEKLNRDEEAISEFTDLKASNPDNKEVELILKNLKAGRSPFASATPPVDDTPEKRSKLPLEEKAEKTQEDEE
ncbi:MAG: tetratricopeptide repeat protein [bacterium]|nr:tetratricopeptide repeat protein [bacterium]